VAAHQAQMFLGFISARCIPATDIKDGCLATEGSQAGPLFPYSVPSPTPSFDLFQMFFAISILATLASLSASVSGSPAVERAAPKDNTTASSKGAVSADAPHFVIYADLFVSGGAPPVEKLAGYNV
jgi:hypothetical protein